MLQDICKKYKSHASSPEKKLIQLNGSNVTDPLQCTFCKRIIREPLVLQCSHFLCLTCADFLKEERKTQSKQSKLSLICPECQTLSFTQNLSQLQILCWKQKPLPKNQYTLHKSDLISPNNDLEYRRPMIDINPCSPQNNFASNMKNDNCTTIISVSPIKSTDIQLENQVSNNIQHRFQIPCILNWSLLKENQQSKESSHVFNQKEQKKQQQNKVESVKNYKLREGNVQNVRIKNEQQKENEGSRVYKYIFQKDNSQKANDQEESSQRVTRPLASHPIILRDQNETKEKMIENQSSIPHQVKCIIHNEPITFFRSSDKSLLCMECVFSANSSAPKNQKIIPLKNAQQLLKKGNESFKAMSTQQLSDLEISLQVSNQSRTTLDREYSQNKSRINEIFEELMKIIHFKRNKVIELIDQNYNTEVKAGELRVKDLNFLKQTLESQKQYDSKSDKDPSTDLYVFSVYKMIQSTLEKICIKQIPHQKPFIINPLETQQRVAFSKSLDKILNIPFQKQCSNQNNNLNKLQQCDSQSYPFRNPSTQQSSQIPYVVQGDTQISSASTTAFFPSQKLSPFLSITHTQKRSSDQNILVNFEKLTSNSQQKKKSCKNVSQTHFHDNYFNQKRQYCKNSARTSLSSSKDFGIISQDKVGYLKDSKGKCRSASISGSQLDCERQKHDPFLLRRNSMNAYQDQKPNNFTFQKEIIFKPKNNLEFNEEMISIRSPLKEYIIN